MEKQNKKTATKNSKRQGAVSRINPRNILIAAATVFGFVGLFLVIGRMFSYYFGSENDNSINFSSTNPITTDQNIEFTNPKTTYTETTQTHNIYSTLYSKLSSATKTTSTETTQTRNIYSTLYSKLSSTTKTTYTMPQGTPNSATLTTTSVVPQAIQQSILVPNKQTSGNTYNKKNKDAAIVAIIGTAGQISLTAKAGEAIVGALATGGGAGALATGGGAGALATGGGAGALATGGGAGALATGGGAGALATGGGAEEGVASIVNSIIAPQNTNNNLARPIIEGRSNHQPSNRNFDRFINDVRNMRDEELDALNQDLNDQIMDLDLEDSQIDLQDTSDLQQIKNEIKNLQQRLVSENDTQTRIDLKKQIEELSKKETEALQPNDKITSLRKKHGIVNNELETRLHIQRSLQRENKDNVVSGGSQQLGNAKVKNPNDDILDEIIIYENNPEPQQVSQSKLDSANNKMDEVVFTLDKSTIKTELPQQSILKNEQELLTTTQNPTSSSTWQEQETFQKTLNQLQKEQNELQEDLTKVQNVKVIMAQEYEKNKNNIEKSKKELANLRQKSYRFPIHINIQNKINEKQKQIRKLENKQFLFKLQNMIICEIKSRIVATEEEIKKIKEKKAYQYRDIALGLCGDLLSL